MKRNDWKRQLMTVSNFTSFCKSFTYRVYCFYYYSPSNMLQRGILLKCIQSRRKSSMVLLILWCLFQYMFLLRNLVLVGLYVWEVLRNRFLKFHRILYRDLEAFHKWDQEDNQAEECSIWWSCLFLYLQPLHSVFVCCIDVIDKDQEDNDCQHFFLKQNAVWFSFFSLRWRINFTSQCFWLFIVY